MPMYYPEWSKHDLEGEYVASLTMEYTDLTAVVCFGYYAEVEAKWSIYDFNAEDPEDYPEPPCFESYEVENLTLYINGEEAMPGDTLYSMCRDWAMEQIKYYDYEGEAPETEGRDDER